MTAGHNFIDPTAHITGKFHTGSWDYIGPFVAVEAFGDFKVQLSDRDNLQDNVILSATNRDTTIGERSSIAHGARVSNSVIGNFVFIGFNARVEDAVIEDGAMILHGAQVSGVTIPANRIVPPGEVIIAPDQIDQLCSLVEADTHFKAEVVAVNVELAEGYERMAAELGPASVEGVSCNPQTSWNVQQILPAFGKKVVLAPDTRVIGNVQLGDDSAVASRVSLRADEGIPIVIGNRARIGERVTFHALEGQTIRVGDEVTVGRRCVLHGGLVVGSQVNVGENAVLFKSTIGDKVSIGKDALVIGVRLADGVKVPDGLCVLDQASADRLSA